MTTIDPDAARHPGAILRADFLEPLGISAYRLARATGLSPTHVGQILRGTRGISTRAALRLSKALGLPDRFWLDVQAGYDIDRERGSPSCGLERVERLVAGEAATETPSSSARQCPASKDQGSPDVPSRTTRS